MFLRIREALDTLLNNLPVPIHRMVIAYSGGLDSTVLLHAIATDMSNHRACHVLHINHQLSPNALLWAKHCRYQAAAYHMPYHEERVTVEVEQHGLEAAARTARYQVFNAYAKAGTVILTAHHADDQVETVLLRILRGTGIEGIRGIPRQRVLGEGFILRPFLHVQRSELVAYAQQHKLSFITDESNDNLNFERNDCRHRLIPYLLQTNPAIKQHLQQLAINAQEACAILEPLIAKAYTACQMNSKMQLNLTIFNEYDTIMQRQILRYWLVTVNELTAPSRAQIIQLQEDVIGAASDKCPVIQLGSFFCRRYQQCLYLTSITQPKILSEVYHWDVASTLDTVVGLLDPAIVKQQLALPAHAVIEVRFRQGGERFHPAGRVGSHPLKKCLQEWGIPPWERYRLPLLYYQNECIMVYGISVADGWRSVPLPKMASTPPNLV